MNYIYDVTLNFNKNFYDYYEWNKKDKIANIKIIPFFKTTTKKLKTIINNNVKFDKNFLNKIKYKTETYNKNKIKFAFLISDGKNTIGIKIDNTLKKSSLPIDEHNEITGIIAKKNIQNINFKILKNNTIDNFKTRFEIENEKYINKELSIIKTNNDKNILSYICLECFGKSENNIENAIYKIKKEITKGNDNFYKIFNILKIANQK